MPQATDSDNTTPLPASATRDRTASGIYLLRLAAGVAVVLWFLLLATHLWRTDSGLWYQGPTAPLGVFSHLSGSYTFSWQNSPLVLLAVAVFALAVYCGIGWLFIRLFDVYFLRVEEWALALLLGAGLCGLLFEFLGMAGGLSRWPVVIGLVVLGGALALLLRGRRGWTLEVWDAAGRRALCDKVAPVEEEEPIEDPRTRFERVERAREGWVSLNNSARAFTEGVERRSNLRDVWRRGFSNTLTPRESPVAQVVWSLAFVLIALITLLTFDHALFYPETYWDSLILYLGYGRETFLSHGFPFKACAQVGIGLGANYPHLYSTHAAAVSAVLGNWTDVPARLYAPVAALAATILIYGAALRVWRNRLVAIVSALVFRALPYQIAYSTYASNYALAMLFGAAMLFLAVCYVDSPLPGTFVLLTVIPALSMHLNYLMGVLWVVWVAALLAAHWRRPKSPLDSVVAGERTLLKKDEYIDEDSAGEQVGDPYFAQAWRVPGPFGLLAKRRFWVVFLLAIVFAVTWNVRNWWLTGNPVYAFFPKIFDGIRINEAVLRSAEHEWFENGDGIGRLAATVPSMETLVNPDDELTTATAAAQASQANLAKRTLGERLAASWMYWIGFDTFYYPGHGNRLLRGRWRDRFAHLLGDWHIPDRNRPLEFGAVRVERRTGATTATLNRPPLRPKPLAGIAVIHWPHAYKLAPTTAGLALPGFLLWLLGCVLAIVRVLREPDLRTFDLRVRAGFVIAVFSLLFLAYEYLIADLYLYQILPFVVGVALFAGWPAGLLLGWAESRRGRIEFTILFSLLYATLLLVGLVPGVAMSLMGFKFTGARRYAGAEFTQLNLAAFHHPGMPPEDFLRLQYGDDVDAWQYLNEHLLGQRLLTHENRDYVLAPSITLVNLDDWDIQKTYTMKSNREKMALFRSLGIRYYYHIPNEVNDPINKRVGLDAWKGTPLMTEVDKWGGNVLYEFHWSAVGLPDAYPKELKPLESYTPLPR